ncbi:MAG: tRNA pseudouridine(13) synthase TruD [Candidatus Nitrosopolaris sp.]
MPIIDVPGIDRKAGMKCYCTSFSGVGGSIKRKANQFRVSEIIDGSVFSDLVPFQDKFHRYPLYILEKSNIDSNHAVSQIKKKFGIELKVIGLKDAKANTKQYATTEQLKKIPREIRTDELLLDLCGFTRKPLRKASLLGNEFTIIIKDTVPLDVSIFEAEIKNIANFYGLQRFGSERSVTHLVGKEILKRNFRNAVELLLCYTSEYDSKMSREIREKCRDPHNYPWLLKHLPRGMDIEYQLMLAIVKGKDAIFALRSIPINMRRLFVQAYQAYIYNLCLSKAVMNEENLLKGKKGDLCFETEGPFIFGKIRKFDPVCDSDSNAVPAIRLAGYSFQGGEGRFEMITKDTMKDECITARDFYIKEMQELSSQGGFRQAPLWSVDFSFVNETSLTLSFKLPKGSYATTLLRELMKPADPISSGF